MKKTTGRKLRLLNIFIFTAMILSAAALSLAGCAQRSEKIRMGTAGIGGNYYSFGKTFAEFLMIDIRDAEVEVMVTTGSRANLRMITEEKPQIELAIIQADVLSEMEDASGTNSGLGIIAGMYTEAVQIVAREDSGISSVSDLRGKTVGVGEEESGSEKNALQILSVCGIDETMFKPVHLGYASASEALEKGSIDAFFCTMGTPSNAIRQLAKKVPLRILSLGSEEADAVIAAHPYYVKHTIPAGTYNGQEENVQTIGVKSVLVASDTLGKNTVKRITKSLFDHARELRYAVAVNYQPDPQEAVKDLPLELHEGAKEWYSENGIEVFQ